jgi:hypothetical protein
MYLHNSSAGFCAFQQDENLASSPFFSSLLDLSPPTFAFSTIQLLS